MTRRLFFIFCFFCAQLSAVIPKPASMQKQKGSFTFKPDAEIIVTPDSQEAKELQEMARAYLPAGNVQIKLDKEAHQCREGYRLSITKDVVTIEAKEPRGAFWGVQTLRQLTRSNKTVPCMTIKDYPRFRYRGLHLDVARHFFDVSFIKRSIDRMADAKLNRFHWHLTDDQGWRIEIKKYPLLSQIAAYRDETLIGHSRDEPKVFDGVRYGGYYTQEEIKEVVEYARRRYIEVIPEIELPGHSSSQLAAYPELGCTGGPYKTATKWGVFDDIMCAGNEKSFEFLQDVLTEVMELFPGRYIHIGGDEAPKSRWKVCPKCQARIKAEGLKDEHELQSYFVKRIDAFLTSKGRKLIGWDEILEGGLAPNAIVMAWRGIQGGIQACKEKHQVIMTPCEYLYLDFYQSRSSHEPLAIGGYTPLKKVYEYDPIPSELSKREAKYIIGAQANVWTEYMATEKQVEYMLLPRLYALSEVVWSPKRVKNYADFKKRLKHKREIVP